MLCSLLGRNRQAYYWRLAAGEKEVFGAELLVQEVLTRLGEHFEVSTESITTAVEQVVFKLPRALAAD